MQNRHSNNIDKNNANKHNYFWQSVIGGTASIAGVFNGTLAGENVYFPKPALPYAFVTAFVTGVGLYGVLRLHSICISNNKDLNSKSEAKSQAAIAAIASGTSTLTGWIAIRHFGEKYLHIPTADPTFYNRMLMRSLRLTMVGAGLVGFGFPVLVNKVQNRYQKLEGLNLKEKAKFLLLNNQSKNAKAPRMQYEEKKNTQSSSFRK